MTIRIDGTNTAANPGITGTDTDTGLQFGTDEVNIVTGGSTRATVDSSGRVLIGTTSAKANFENGSTTPQFQIESTSLNGASLSIVRDGNDTGGPKLFLAHGRTDAGLVSNGDELGGLFFSGGDGNEFVSSAGISAVVDGTPGANDMPGRLVFSTTADGASSPTARMELKNDGRIRLFSDANQSINLCSVKGGNTSDLFFVGKHSATGFDSGTNAIIVFTNGNVVNANNSYGSLSDIKLKENIVDAKSQWDDLKALQVRNYNFKEGQTHTQIGLIAQEVELVSPGLVSESPDRDEDGNDLGTTTKSVNYSVLYMKAVKALQEAMERIETLETRVAQLEGGAS